MLKPFLIRNLLVTLTASFSFLAAAARKESCESSLIRGGKVTVCHDKIVGSDAARVLIHLSADQKAMAVEFQDLREGPGRIENPYKTRWTESYKFTNKIGDSRYYVGNRTRAVIDGLKDYGVIRELGIWTARHPATGKFDFIEVHCVPSATSRP